jgi:hypothetical protein
MCHGHQASASRAKVVAARQIEGQRSEQGQHLHTISVAVVVSVLTELGVAKPVVLVFDCPALTHQTQQCFWACAQCGQEIVDLALGPATA